MNEKLKKVLNLLLLSEDKVVTENEVNLSEVVLDNGTVLVSDATLTSETAPNLSVYILGYNNNNNLGSASTKECRVAFLGLGMTDAKVQAINTAVQTFLTTLSKNI